MIVPAAMALFGVGCFVWSKRTNPKKLIAGTGYHTHYPALASALTLGDTTKPVLELGAGEGSTVLLHTMCEAQGRPLVTCESNPYYLAKFQSLQTPQHNLVPVANWDGAPIEAIAATPWQRWGVVFIDHGSWGNPNDLPTRRPRDVMRALEHADIVVAHDTEDPRYGYEAAFQTAPYRYDFTVEKPYTTLVSRTAPLPFARAV